MSIYVIFCVPCWASTGTLHERKGECLWWRGDQVRRLAGHRHQAAIMAGEMLIGVGVSLVEALVDAQHL